MAKNSLQFLTQSLFGLGGILRDQTRDERNFAAGQKARAEDVASRDRSATLQERYQKTAEERMNTEFARDKKAKAVQGFGNVWGEMLKTKEYIGKPLEAFKDAVAQYRNQPEVIAALEEVYPSQFAKIRKLYSSPAGPGVVPAGKYPPGPMNPYGQMRAPVPDTAYNPPNPSAAESLPLDPLRNKRLGGGMPRPGTPTASPTPIDPYLLRKLSGYR